MRLFELLKNKRKDRVYKSFNKKDTIILIISMLAQRYNIPIRELFNKISKYKDVPYSLKHILISILYHNFKFDSYSIARGFRMNKPLVEQIIDKVDIEMISELSDEIMNELLNFNKKFIENVIKQNELDLEIYIKKIC